MARNAYEAEYQLDQRTLLDVLDSQNELYDTQIAFVRAETGLIAARATALAEAGELLTSFGVTIDRLSGDEWDWDPSLSSAFASCPNDPTDPVEVDFDNIYDRFIRSAEP